MRRSTQPAYSDTNGAGFENKISELFAKELGKAISFTWFPNAPGFVRQTLALYKCDIIMGVPQGDDIVQVTNPYTTPRMLVFRPGRGLDGIDTLTDPRLKDKQIGVVGLRLQPIWYSTVSWRKPSPIRSSSIRGLICPQLQWSMTLMGPSMPECCGVHWRAITRNLRSPYYRAAA